MTTIKVIYGFRVYDDDDFCDEIKLCKGYESVCYDCVNLEDGFFGIEVGQFLDYHHVELTPDGLDAGGLIIPSQASDETKEQYKEYLKVLPSDIRDKVPQPTLHVIWSTSV